MDLLKEDLKTYQIFDIKIKMGTKSKLTSNTMLQGLAGSVASDSLPQSHAVYMV